MVTNMPTESMSGQHRIFISCDPLEFDGVSQRKGVIQGIHEQGWGPDLRDHARAASFIPKVLNFFVAVHNTSIKLVESLTVAAFSNFSHRLHNIHAIVGFEFRNQFGVLLAVPDKKFGQIAAEPSIVKSAHFTFVQIYRNLLQNHWCLNHGSC